MKTKLIVTNIATLLALGAILLFGQGGGPLVPPGPPAVTMLTLDEAEPRTPLIDGAPDTAAVQTSDVSYHFIIKSPGSYFLTANLSVTKTNGIDIRAAGVSLDLRGFQIRRTAGSDGNAIEVASTSDRCTIRNGSIGSDLFSFATGVEFEFGPDPRIGADRYAVAGSLIDLSVTNCDLDGLSAGESCELTRCHAHGNGEDGIEAETRCILTDCSAHQNGADGIEADAGCTLRDCTSSANAGSGIRVGNGCSLTNCTASSNTGTFGFLTGDGCALNNCTAQNNAFRAGPLLSATAGIYVLDACTITNCTSNQNASTSGSDFPNQGMGIQCGESCTIRGCTIAENGGHGIRGVRENFLTGNTCSFNGRQVSAGAGINLSSNSNRIDGNHVTGNDFGIDVDGSKNLIIRNSADANTTNYSFAAGNLDAQILTPGSGFVSTDPWANFDFGP